jgi:calcium-dependent protein kinase
MAPEVIKGNYTEKCDIWSAGVILYLMLSGHLPFHGRTPSDTEAKVKKGKFVMDQGWESISKEAKHLINKLLEYDATKRYSSSTTLQDPWFSFAISKSRTRNEQEVQHALSNVVNFESAKKFQDAVWVYLVTHFTTEDEKKELTAVFKKLDKNNDGTVSKEELMEACKKYDIGELNENEINELFKRLDRNGNGNLDYTGN